MKALVTGATGFIGSNLARELLRQGYQVKALVREDSDLRNIEGLDIQVAPGDLTQRASLDEALAGCDVLFHVAASYSFWTPDPRAVYQTNVEGTRNILTAARAKGISKVVYTSTESTIGISKNERREAEELFADPKSVAGHYKKSKCMAERVALDMCNAGLPLVVVNPTTPIGPFDVKPTPTGQLIVDFLNRRMPAYVNTGLNLVDVEDVARGHVLALEEGRIGERYILGSQNYTLKEILGMLERITGIPAPRIRIPLWTALGAAYVDEFLSGHVFRKRPRIPVAAVKTAGKFRHFPPAADSKAARELGFAPSPVDLALGKAVRWFRQNGYAN
ncbi:MAG: NAD-dependent epimerase/dehydratase family protein [Dehalococcoidia bacterium]|nr:NAD-dependent epimerase/dehydratase family protein [Dehalococcoidia bacterium]